MTLSEWEQREWRAITRTLRSDDPTGPDRTAVPARGRVARVVGWVLVAVAVLILAGATTLLALSMLWHDPNLVVVGRR